MPEPRGRELVRRRAEARDEAVARLWRIPEAQLRVRGGDGAVQGLQQLDGLLSRRRVRRALALLDGEGPILRRTAGADFGRFIGLSSLGLGFGKSAGSSALLANCANSFRVTTSLESSLSSASNNRSICRSLGGGLSSDRSRDLRLWRWMPPWPHTSSCLKIMP